MSFQAPAASTGLGARKGCLIVTAWVVAALIGITIIAAIVGTNTTTRTRTTRPPETTTTLSDSDFDKINKAAARLVVGSYTPSEIALLCEAMRVAPDFVRRSFLEGGEDGPAMWPYYRDELEKYC